MLENVGRKLFLIFALLGASIGLLLFKNPSFRLGLDLDGGRRLVYSIPFDELIRNNQLDPNANRQELLQETITILHQRVDPTGVKEPIIRQEGKNRIVIETPGEYGASIASRSGKLAVGLGPTDGVIVLDGTDPAAVAGFPASGGVIQIGTEKIRYERREDNEFHTLDRGYQKSPAVQHAAGETVTLFSDDAFKNAIENLGELAFQIVAKESDLAGKGTDFQDEQTRMQAWATKNPGLPLSSYNKLTREQGGPHESIEWVPHNWDATSGKAEPPDFKVTSALPLLRPEKLDKPGDYRDDNWKFTGQDLDRTYSTSDQYGYPAVGFEFLAQRKAHFGNFTKNFTNRNMAIVLNAEVHSYPVIKGRLSGGGIIEGKFTQQAVESLVTVLRSGSLKIKPVLEEEELVWPTLGAENIRRNMWAGLLTLAVVSGFMIAYYRLLGVLASIALLANIVLLIGGLAFMDATLTLPGIGGIILTMGMALDANILIFERIREEQASGKNIKQAAKEGFDKAFTAIFDSNITTLISGLILYNVGSGPVRGFAVTLSIGILTTMFAQLVITRVLVHYALVRGLKQFKMAHWLSNPNYKFMDKWKACVAGSVLVTGAGLLLFALLPTKQKLGLEFTGGATVRVLTEEPVTREQIQELVAKIPNDIGASEVKPAGDSLGGGRYTSFRITFKIDPDKPAEEVDTKTFEQEIRQGLMPLLQKGPVEVLSSTPPTAELKIYFSEPHAEADVAERLSSLAGVSNPVVKVDPQRPDHFLASAGLSAPLDPQDFQQSVKNAFAGQSDGRGKEYNLASAVAESALVGKQVVGELRDKAVLAVLLSMLGILLYVRVRFAEYSYGIGAIVSLLHDVLITLAACAVAIKFGFINAEIDITMISVFLTIIGYSVNDTIVNFDRVRENLPRMKKPLVEVLNISLNQTLSRTILTSTTTFLSVAIMLAFNLGTGNQLEGFCYAMLAGMISGVYSTIYIASPVMLWWETRMEKKKQQAGEGGAKSVEMEPGTAH